MSFQTVDQIMNRISSSSPERQIAVFKADFAITKRKAPVLEVFLAQSVETQRLIKQGGQNYVGCFDKTMKRKKVQERLIAATSADDLSLSGWKGAGIG